MSENKYRILFNTATSAILIVKLLSEDKHQIIDCNEQALKLFGCKREDIINKTPEDFSPPIQPDGNMVSSKKAIGFSRAAKEAGPQFFEWLHCRLDGTHFWAEVNLNYIEIGSEKYLQALINDISERKQAEELFRSLAANSPVGVYIVQKGKFVYTNPQFQQYSGYREDELLSMEALSLVFPEDRETVRNNAIQMLKGKHVVPYEFRITNKNGEIKWALESVASIQYQGKQAAIGSYQDITERKRVEQRLRNEFEWKKFLLRLYEKAPQLTDKELYDYVIEQAVRLSESTIGFFHLVCRRPEVHNSHNVE